MTPFLRNTTPSQERGELCVDIIHDLPGVLFNDSGVKNQALRRGLTPLRFDAQTRPQSEGAQLIGFELGPAQTVLSPSSTTRDDVVEGLVNGAEPRLGPTNRTAVRRIIALFLVF